MGHYLAPRGFRETRTDNFREQWGLQNYSRLETR